MRSFLLLSAFFLLANARPDVSSLGYNYQQPGGSNGIGQIGGPGSGPGGPGFGGAGPGLGSNGIGPSGSGLGGGFGRGPGFGGDDSAIINKHFYLHSAPEDNDSGRQAKHFTLGRAQKNYRVVFIKAPSSSNANTGLSAEYAPSEEKTVIYVLSQKEHELDVNDIATPAPTEPSKPEVFFIKYKTPEEAAHAQREIQSQYDRLGGSTQVSDEGTAPVSSVVGAVGNDQGHHGPASGSYLPPRY